MTADADLEHDPLGHLPERIAQKISIDHTTECWMWIGARDRSGYGTAWWQGRNAVAHRVVAHLLTDSRVAVFPGRGRSQLDHICRQPSCVNPLHLEEVSNRENGIRGRSGVLGVHTSGFVGVSWDASKSAWRAIIEVDGHRIHLGYGDDESALAHAYDAAALVAYSDPTNHRHGLLDRLPNLIELSVAQVRLQRAERRAITELPPPLGCGHSLTSRGPDGVVRCSYCNKEVE